MKVAHRFGMTKGVEGTIGIDRYIDQPFAIIQPPGTHQHFRHVGVRQDSTGQIRIGARRRPRIHRHEPGRAQRFCGSAGPGDRHAARCN